METVQFVLEVS